MFHPLVHALIEVCSPGIWNELGANSNVRLLRVLLPPPRVVAQFRSTLEPPALYLTATEFALTQACPDLPSDSAPHI